MLFRSIVFEIPALFILNYLFPLYGLPFAQAAAEFLLAVIAGFVLVKLFRKLGENRENVVKTNENE